MNLKDQPNTRNTRAGGKGVGMNTQSGAVLVDECPTYPHKCKCGKCRLCGYDKHSAIHGAVNDGHAGSKPFGHEFELLFTPAPREAKCPTCGRKF